MGAPSGVLGPPPDALEWFREVPRVPVRNHQFHNIKMMIRELLRPSGDPCFRPSPPDGPEADTLGSIDGLRFAQVSYLGRAL